MSHIPQFHIIEKEQEVVFYIPYDHDLVNVYTAEFFALHSQNAEVSVIAFHNNDSVAYTGGNANYTEEDMSIKMPYRFFYNRAKYIDEELKKRFGLSPSKESSYSLFSTLIDNARQIFQPKPAVEEPEPLEKEPTVLESLQKTFTDESKEEEKEPTFLESLQKTFTPESKEEEKEEEPSFLDTLQNTFIPESKEEEKEEEEPSFLETLTPEPKKEEEKEEEPSFLDTLQNTFTPESKEEKEPSEPEQKTMAMELPTPVLLERETSRSIPTGYIFQIIIQKKPPTTIAKPKLKIPIDVLLEKEIDYFNEHAPNRTITEKYALHGIYMVA